MKNYKTINLLFLVLLFISCNEKVDDQLNPDQLILSVNKNILMADSTDSVIFSVTDYKGDDQTGNCMYYINNEAFYDTIFKTSVSGSYTVEARLDDLESNEVAIAASSREILSIELAVDKTEALADGVDMVSFTVIDDIGNDVTSLVSLFANDEKMSGSALSSDIEEDYTVKAVLGNMTSTANVSFITNQKDFIKRVIIEQYTATWCGYCPWMITAIEDVLEKSELIIPVAVHNRDKMAYEHFSSMAQRFGVSGTPNGFVNRSSKWNGNFKQLENELEKTAMLGIAISTTLINRNAFIDIKVKFKDTFSDDFKLLVCLTENKLIYNQANYYDDGRGNPMKDFEHNYVLRKAYTDIFGDEKKNSAISEHNLFKSEYHETISEDFNTDNCFIVVCVLNGSDDEVLNVQRVKLGEEVGY